MILKKTLILYSLLLISFLVYSLGISGPLLLDDFYNLEALGYFGGVNDWASAHRFIFSNESGPLGRPVSVATFLLDDATWPIADVSTFKLTNIAFHLCTGLFIFLLINRLLQQEFEMTNQKAEIFAFFSMAIWLLHPIQVSTVLYVVQRMAILSAMFSVACFICYLQCRDYFRKQRLAKVLFSLLASVVFFLLAIYSKENAFLVIPFIFLCEFFIFETVFSAKLKYLAMRATYIIVLSSPIWLYMTYHIWGAGYPIREFNLIERVILQVAVLGDYLSKLLLPTVGSMNLFDERFLPSAISLFNYEFVKGLLFSFGLLVLFIYAVLKKQRLILFGIIWFLTFHLLESSIFPLEIYFEHRNYLPSIGVFIVMVELLRLIGDKCSSTFLSSTIIGAYLLYLCFSCSVLAKTWDDSASLFVKFSGDQPSSVRAKSTYARYLEEIGLPEFALPELEAAISLRPDLLSLSLNKLRLVCLYDLKTDQQMLLEQILNANYFETAVFSQLKSLIAMPKEQCKLLDELPLIETVFEKIENMPGFGLRSRVVAQFYYLKTDYYVNKRAFGDAILSLDKAISATPTVDLFLRKTVLLTSAGLFEEALKSADNALEADKRRGAFIPSRIDEIEYVIMSLKNQLKKET